MNTGYQYTNFRLKTTSGISSNTTGKILFDGQEKDIPIYPVGNTSQYSNWVMPSTEGTYPYSVVYNNKTVCVGTIKVVDPASNLTANCAITDNNNNTITAGALSQQIKFKVTNQNTSGNAVKLLLLGKESLWENGANINKDFVDTVWWNNGQTLESQFNLPLTVGSYTYTLKTLSGSKELCSVDFEVKGPEATCKFKYNDNDVTEVAGGTSNIIFDVSDVKNVTNNYTAKLNFNGTSKAIDCGNSNCWNNSFNAPAAESEDKDHEFTLTTADGSHEICKATLTVKGTGGSGGGGSDPSISVGTYSNSEIRKNDYQANVWYSVDIEKNGSLVMQNHSSTESSLTYKDCSGSEQTKSIKTGSNGDAGGGWWNSLGNVSNGCKIVFKFSSGGDFAIQIW